MNREELYRRLAEQKEEMRPEERIEAYLRGEETDYLPYGLLAPEDALANIWGYTKGQVHRSFDIRCEMIRRKKEEYGFYGLSIPMGLRGIGEAAGSVLEYPENAVDYVKEYFVTDYDILNHLEEFSIKSNGLLSSKIEEGKKLMELFPDMGISTDVAGPFSTVIAMRPIEFVLRDLRKRPDKIHQLLSYAVECSLKWIEIFYQETGSTAVGFADPVTTTDILGRKDFLEFSKPYMKKLIDGIVEITGNAPSVHICGHTKGIWQDLIEIGVNNFSLDNCEDLEEAKNMMGEKVFLSGNVAPVDIMRLGSIDMVIEAVRTAILKAGDSPSGYMLMTGCQVPIGTPKENIDAYIYAARKYGRGARLGRRPKGLVEEMA